MIKYKNFIKFICVTTLAMSISGCSGERPVDGKEFGNPISKIYKEITKGQVVKQVKIWDKEIAQPAIKIYSGYLSEYAKLRKAGEKDELKIRKKLQPQAQEGVKALNALKDKIAQLDAIKATDAYLYYTRLYIDRAIERLECADKMVSAADKKQLINFRNRGWHLEGRLVYEARYGYDNAAGILLKQESTYNITDASVKRIKKGQSYETVMHILRMPGIWLTTISVPKDKKIEQHQQAIWINGDQMIYVEFVNGRVNTWKAVGANKGFLNKK